jgi:hypothetical protein
MKNIIVVCASVLLIIAFFSCGLVRIKTRIPVFSKMDKYENLLARAKSMDSTLVFYELRMSYTKTNDYHSNDPTMDGRIYRMNKDLETNANYDEAKRIADTILQSYYVCITAHHCCMEVYIHKGDSAMAKYHRFFVEGIVNSVLKSGDGRYPGTAWPVISKDEEKFVAANKGYDVYGTASFFKDDVYWDIVMCMKDKDEKFYIFNTNAMFNAFLNY